VNKDCTRRKNTAHATR